MLNRGDGARWLGVTPMVAVCFAFVLVLGGIVPAAAAPAPAGAGTKTAAISASQFCPNSAELAVLSYVNNYRAKYGLPKLRFSAKLGAAAKHHSQDMANRNYFSHTLYNGTSWYQNIVNHGYTYNTYTGENIAAGNQGPWATFQQWVNSPAHRANMLSANFKSIGIGRAYNAASRYDWYWTQTFGGYADAGPSC